MPDEIIEHEPNMAFDGGTFGIKILTRLIKETPRYLKKNSWLAFEVGLGQGEPMLKRLDKIVIIVILGLLKMRMVRYEQ